MRHKKDAQPHTTLRIARKTFKKRKLGLPQVNCIWSKVMASSRLWCRLWQYCHDATTHRSFALSDEGWGGPREWVVRSHMYATFNRGWFFLKRDSVLFCLFRLVRAVLIYFWGFWAILMVLAVWPRFSESVWCRNHSKIWSGGQLFISFRVFVSVFTVFVSVF